MPQPPITDAAAIIDWVRSNGSAHWPLDSVPGDFLEWRRRIRRASKEGDLRVSVLRANDVAIVQNRDYEPTMEQKAAVMEAVAQIMQPDVQPADYETLLHRRRRARLSVVPDEPDGPRPGQHSPARDLGDE